MKHAILIMIFLKFSFVGFSQSDEVELPNQSVGIQILGPALFTLQYEIYFISKDHIAISSDVGFGRAEYPDDSYIPSAPGTLNLNTGINFSFGFPSIKAVCSVSPSTYFHGGLTFVNISGIFGVRYFFKGDNPLYLMGAYTPKLYTSLTTNEYIYTHFNFGIRFGLYF